MAYGKKALTTLLVLAAGMSALATSLAPSAVEDIQAALAALRDGRLHEADRLAVGTASGDADGAWRAWLVAADARQRLKRYAQAEHAYAQFMALCTRPEDRQYALGRIRQCRNAVAGNARPEPASRRLTERQLAELAAVDEATWTESTEHFVVHAANAPLAKLVAEESERALKQICHALLSGQGYPHSVDVYVWPDLSEYRRHATSAPHWSGGSFSLQPGEGGGQLVRRIDLTQLDERKRFDPDVIDRVLPHEMSHLVLAEQFGDARCPLFLNEGLAMMAETVVDNGRVKLAGAALAGQTKIAIGELLAADKCPPEQADIFYAEAYSLADYLHARLTGPQFRELLAHLKAGCPFDEAAQRALYSPPDGQFLDRLAAAWENDAVRQAQFLQAVEDQLSRLP